nr:hypothetical protein [Tanacetum cinerariifolium]
DDEAPLEDQPLPADASPTAASPGYMTNFDPEEDPEEDPKEDPEEDPKDDQVDYPTDGGDGDDEPSDGNEDNTDDEDPEEEPFEENDEEKKEHPAPADSPAMHTVDLVLSARETEALEADEPTHADMPPRKRACLTAPGFEIGESSAAGAARQPRTTESDLRRCRVEQEGYGITDTWDEIVDKMMEIAPTTLEGFDRALLRARVNTLYRDRPDHRHTAMLIDREAMYSREAWAFSMDRSSAMAAHVRTLKTQVAALI